MAILDFEGEFLTKNQIDELCDIQKTRLITLLMMEKEMLKEVEVNRFCSRQAKCSHCIFKHDISCCDKACYPADRLDKKSVYFAADNTNEQYESLALEKH